jgi:hypothetical protein
VTDEMDEKRPCAEEKAAETKAKAKARGPLETDGEDTGFLNKD